MRKVARTPMGGDGDQAPTRAEAQAPAGMISSRERASLAKRRELAAHERAIKRHDEAAQLQDRLGRPDRAAKAREHARRARELHELALRELREWERQRTAGEDEPAP